jgi:hypothetical protein
LTRNQSEKVNNANNSFGNMFVYRKDLKNCGDYWCSPQLYFDEYKNFDSYDILDVDDNFNFSNFIILGGGGLGKKLFQDKINSLFKKNTNKIFICWGVGFNDYDYLKQNQVITKLNLAKKVKHNHFSKFNLVGIRDSNLPFDYFWVPCVSCLHPYFKNLRKKKPTKKIGVFYHHRMKLNIQGIDPMDYMSNYGINLEEKLNFLSDYQFIITNSYHGAYWGQLMNKKVLCYPVKSSLLNFLYEPNYIMKNITKDILDGCKNYPDFLDLCINANISFKKKVKEYIGV